MVKDSTLLSTILKYCYQGYQVLMFIKTPLAQINGFLFRVVNTSNAMRCPGC